MSSIFGFISTSHMMDSIPHGVPLGITGGLILVPFCATLAAIICRPLLGLYIMLASMAYNLFIAITAVVTYLRVPNYSEYMSMEIMGNSIAFGVDSLSAYFLLLTAFLLPICLLLSLNYNKYQGYITIVYGSILFLLNVVFTVQDLLGFYISFESIVIPMFVLIGVWGSREEKVKAGYYFIIYTIGGSILLLLAILELKKATGTTDYFMLKNLEIAPALQIFLFTGFFFSFASKIPLVPFHIWLPLAHVEAPVGGSVILAGLLIKLGTFGFIKFALPLTPIACVRLAPIILGLSIISVIYASLTTMRQTDLKRIIAYSSVAHMGVATLGIFTFTTVGLQASVFLQLAHGLVSSALFILVTILYNHHHTRLIAYYRGVGLAMPIFTLVFVIATLCNIGVPMSGNFIGEFLSLLAAFKYSPWTSILAATGVVLSACYALFLLNRVVFGEKSPHLIHMRDMTYTESMILLILCSGAILMGLFPNIILKVVTPELVKIVTIVLSVK